MSVYAVRTSFLPLARKIVLRLLQEPHLDERKIRLIRNELTKGSGKPLPKNLELIAAYRQLVEDGEADPDLRVLNLIQKRKVRTMSGIANITVLTKALGCPGQCIFCPTERGMPKSYLSNEPAMMRAVRNEFDPYRQMKTRLNGLMAQGHDISKIDVRIAGGTWGAVPHAYQVPFVREIYRALQEGAGKPLARHARLADLSLPSLIRLNERSRSRCVGLWVETRPDWVDEAELIRLRSYGVTGVELGIQTTDDAVNAFCKRGHGLKESIRATQLLRDAGFKVCHHLMPNLPTATLESDLRSARDLFGLEGLRPDYLKIYPCVVTPYSELEKMTRKDPALFKPYSEDQLADLLTVIKKGVPEYCRIIRVIRDIPAESIILGVKRTNLRQELERRGVVCRCVRCREIRDLAFRPSDVELVTRSYAANGGQEHFLSFEDRRQDKLIGLCRLRFPGDPAHPVFPELKNAALIRELHVYGREESLYGGEAASRTQHHGFGRRLMAAAEAQAKQAGFKRIAVIAAAGTRPYYRKLGYRLCGTYMLRSL